MDRILLISILLMACLGWLLIPVVIHFCRLSFFRYRMWALRDQIADDLLTEALPTMPITKDFLRMVEGAIMVAPLLTFPHWLCLPRISKQRMEAHNAMMQSGIEELSPEQRTLFEAHRSDFAELFLRRLLVSQRLGRFFFSRVGVEPQEAAMTYQDLDHQSKRGSLAACV